MKSLNILEIKERIFYEEGLDYFEDLYKVLTHDPTKGALKFKYLIEYALKEYEKYRPFEIRKSLYVNNEGSYTFVDNFTAYLNGQIDESNIELIPYAIMKVYKDRYITSNSWKYEQPKLSLPSGNINVDYYTNYPTKLVISKDNEFTKDSCIYGLSYKDPYLTYLKYYLVANILKTINSVNIQLPVTILPTLESNLSTYKENMDDDITSRLNVIKLWRK